MGKKSYIMFITVFAMLVMFSCMAQPSRADFGLMDTKILGDISKSINRLADSVDELVKAEREQTEMLKLVKNKLSDIAVLQSINGGKCWPIYAESEEDSGFRSLYPNSVLKYSKEAGGYYYYNDDLKKYPEEK